MDVNPVKRPEAARPQAAQMTTNRPARRTNKALGWVALVIAVLVIAGLIYLGILLLDKKTNQAGGAVLKDKYQAVFLTNNQVYFGKIESLNESGITLKEIYYLQVQNADDKNAKDQNLSLAKLGSELHGPEDKMFINDDQVLFWENLKDDGKVVQAIKNNTAK